ncbi:MAG: Flp pilus assembly protein CpaB [Pirellulaceae bacterium]|nr:Flp pilus assembly protein CpaB [Pirellulaceae bacterium]
MSRLNAGTIIAAMVAILLSLAGAFLARQLLVSQPSPPAQPPAEPRVIVPVATTDLPAGRELRDGDVGKLELTREQVRSQNLPRVYMTSAAEIVGRTLREPLKAGQAFSPDSLYPQGVGPSLAEELTPGLRGVTIGVTDAGFVNGFASPGSVVDVLFRLNASPEPSPSRTPKAYTILEGVRVLAVERVAFPGTQQDPNQFGLTKVTLAVTPDQAGQLKVLEGNGELVLTLRSEDDLPKEQIESRLSEAAERLQSLLAESETLGQIRNAALQVGKEFDDSARVAELKQSIAREQQLVADLRQSLQQATTPNRVQSLEDILQLRTTPSIVERLKPGMRAVTIGVKGSGFVDGFAVPGTHVDVLFRLSGLDGRTDYRETTFTLLESVEVLAVAQSTETQPVSTAGRRDETITVTLAVTSAEASKLKVVEGRGELSLVLRPMDETLERRPTVARGESEEPSKALQNELAAAQAELDDLLAEQQALQQLERLAQRRQVQFTGVERLTAVQEMIAKTQDRIAQLMTAEEQSTPPAERAPKNQFTLNEVLGIADPPPVPQPIPPKRDTLEIYRAGNRSTVVFERLGGVAGATAGFSGVDAGTTGADAGSSGSIGGGNASDNSGCKDCGKSVIQRPL